MHQGSPKACPSVKREWGIFKASYPVWSCDLLLWPPGGRMDGEHAGIGEGTGCAAGATCSDVTGESRLWEWPQCVQIQRCRA